MNDTKAFYILVRSEDGSYKERLFNGELESFAMVIHATEYEASIICEKLNEQILKLK